MDTLWNYQHQMDKQAEQAHQAIIRQMADPHTEWQYDVDERGGPSEILTLQVKFARDSQLLDEKLAKEVAIVRIPPLFDPAFLEDKALFPAATEELEHYGQLFQEHKNRRMAMLLQVKGKIEQLNLPQNEQQQAVQEFDNTYGIDEALSQKYFDIVIEVSRQGIAYIDFMNLARYRVLNGQVVFMADSESEKHKAFLRIFKRLSEQDVAAQRELAGSREKRMARLRELSR